MIRYAITNRLAFSGDDAARRTALQQQAMYLADAGVEYLQVREKDLPFADAAALAADLLRLTGGRLRVLLNASWSGYAQVWPAGVGLHLSAAELGLLAAQRNAPSHALPAAVSAACHSLQGVEAARRFARLLLFAPVFEKRVDGVQVSAGSGLEALREVCRAAGPVPVLALGGVTPLNVERCMNAGAAGVAGIRLFLPPR